MLLIFGSCFLDLSSQLVPKKQNDLQPARDSAKIILIHKNTFFSSFSCFSSRSTSHYLLSFFFSSNLLTLIIFFTNLFCLLPSFSLYSPSYSFVFSPFLHLLYNRYHFTNSLTFDYFFFVFPPTLSIARLISQIL